MKNKVKSIERDLERYYETDEIDVDLANRVYSHAEWLIERVQELEKENTGLKQDLKCVSEQLESVTDVVWEGEEDA